MNKINQNFILLLNILKDKKYSDIINEDIGKFVRELTYNKQNSFLCNHLGNIYTSQYNEILTIVASKILIRPYFVELVKEISQLVKKTKVINPFFFALIMF